MGDYTKSCNTKSSAPEDGRDRRPKHVEMIGIINKPLLLHLVGCLYYLLVAFHSSVTLTEVFPCFSSVVRQKPV